MDIKDIEKIIKTFEASELQALEIELKGAKIKLSKRKDNDVVVTQDVEKANGNVVGNEVKNVDNKDNLFEVKSPLVGTFYAATAPNDPPLVKAGDTVKAGEVLCIIEAMKIMNEITAPVDGVIVEVMGSNNKTVGFDDVLFLMRETYAK